MRPEVPDRESAEAALQSRLREVARALEPSVDIDAPTRDLLQELSLSVKRNPEPARAWLLFVAVAGAFPQQPELSDLLRKLDLSADGAAMVAVLAATIGAASSANTSLRRLELIVDSVVVDVNFCATHEHNTGIQRVVRETLPRWVASSRAFRMVAWTDDSTAMRGLNETEIDRVLHWSDRQHPVATPSEGPVTIAVPWRCTIVLAEVPLNPLTAAIAAIAESSGNRVAAIGYDAIPLVSAEGQRNAESERFANYLSAVKHADRVVAISESAAEEFRGFVDAIAAQGLDGPAVTAVPLAVEVGAAALAIQRGLAEQAEVPGRPLVLCVGSHEPRKNQEAVLAAAELLLREGLDFELVFVGGGNRGTTAPFDKRVKRLRKRGFAVNSFRRLPDGELWKLYARARFTVFVSLHEGFGLPVAESLALGVPVLTSNYGSLAEIAALGGCVTVDPRDDEQILSAMRELLSDETLVDRLRAETAAIPKRGWQDYADELWLSAGLDKVGAQ